MNLHRLILVFTSMSIIFASLKMARCNLCDCNHCDDGSKVISIRENKLSDDDDDDKENEKIGNDDDNETSLEYQLVLKEDLDGDGIFTICARDRDHEDRSFPSICHMLCHNSCTEFNAKENKESNGTYDVMAYRTNYYKLHDGPCRRHYT
ncbi:uncharacterized protein LOC103577525 [Microplitis demolitor]|uniref:uncharacterized protein LOC103577525 n=1 Tax=Microplitis demolitor TaxID=69319 RepID=UPI0004CCC78E|nr:uncharacterized protein LOC103577525 [Microplitis demolitor]